MKNLTDKIFVKTHLKLHQHMGERDMYRKEFLRNIDDWKIRSIETSIYKYIKNNILVLIEGQVENIK